MILKPGKPTYPLPSTWIPGQQIVLHTPRSNFELVRVELGAFDDKPLERAIPSFYEIDIDKRVVSFWPAPVAAFEVEFVETE